jgi:hypothetical protein
MAAFFLHRLAPPLNPYIYCERELGGNTLYSRYRGAYNFCPPPENEFK